MPYYAENGVVKFAEASVFKTLIECSVCGLWKPDTGIEFRNAGQTERSRTNCRSCYESKDMRKIESDRKEKIRSLALLHVSRSAAHDQAFREADRRNNLIRNSITVEVLIEQLRQLPAGSRVFAGQEGYYADGPLATLNDVPEFTESIDGVNFYEISYSCQNV